jgi:septal ring factor EnvC (AmiA/AmiB activator)
MRLAGSRSPGRCRSCCREGSRGTRRAREGRGRTEAADEAQAAAEAAAAKEAEELAAREKAEAEQKAADEAQAAAEAKANEPVEPVIYDGHTEMRNADGTACSWRGETYEPDADGVVTVPVAAAADLLDHGFSFVPAKA